MKHIEKIVIGMIAVLFVVIVIIATDFWLLWLPLEHSSEYPQKIAALFMAVTAFVTLLVVYTTFNATKQSNLREETRSKDEIEKENRARKERLLNEIIEWALEVSFTSRYVSDVTWDSKASWSEFHLRSGSEITPKLENLRNRGEYIKQVSLTIDKDLGNVIDELIGNIEERRTLFLEEMKFSSPPSEGEMKEALDAFEGRDVKDLENFSPQGKNAIALGMNNWILNRNSYKVIEKATEIKTDLLNF